MPWINILVGLLSNPAIQALIKQIEAQFAQKTAAKVAGMAADVVDPKVAMQQAVDEVVAKHVKTP
jgi:hypothetical protein